MYFSLSFIGVSQSLPMTAYIKMIDIWMIFAMMYPFCVVSLYSVMEALKKTKTKSQISSADCTDTWDLMNKKTIRIVTFLLDWGLPILVTIFIIVFWAAGLANYASSEIANVCKG